MERNIQKNSNSSDATAATSIDPFDGHSSWIGQKSDSDDSPAPSNYSSCEESEFERYCSANSVVGTPSVCSSVGNYSEFLGSDFGSIRNLSFGAEDCVSESFGFRGQFGRNNRKRGGVAVSGGFDCVADGRIGFCRENGDLENGFLLKEAIGNESKLLSDSDANSSSIGGNYGENSEDGLIQTRIGSGLKFLYGLDENTDPYRGVCEEHDNENSENGILLGEAKNGSESVLGSDVNSKSFPSPSQNYQSHKAVQIESYVGNLMPFRTRNAPAFLPSCDGNSQLGADGCTEKDIESFTEQVSGNSGGCLEVSTSVHGVQADGREIGTVPELDEETSSRYEHSDGDDSMLDYGTDDEDRTRLFERRNLQYLKEIKTKNENPLLINSSVAFGSDDWDEFMQETEENSLAHVFSVKPFERQHVHLETKHNLVAMTDSADMAPANSLILEGTEQEEDVRDIPVASFQVQDIKEAVEDLKGCSDGNYREDKKDSRSRKPQAETYSMEDMDVVDSHLNVEDNAAERELRCVSSEEVIGPTKANVLEKDILGGSELCLDPLSDVIIDEFHSKAFQGIEKVGSGEDHELDAFPPLAEKESAATADLGKECLAPDEVEKLNGDEFYDDMVHEMEEILLDSEASHGVRFPQSNRGSSSQQSQTFRDGSSTASTSSTDYACLPIPYPQKIDWVEVIGAKQKRGDVSLGERLVGVKEYTVYVLRVWSGKDQWEVERRYRDFFTLYRQLKALFADHGWNLPTSWSSVERESLKIFGNASPSVISERSALIQECIRSVLHSRPPLGTPTSLGWFLSPCKDPFSSSVMKTRLPLLADDGKPTLFRGDASTEGGSFTLGKTISLLVEVQPRKSVKQLLEAQYYTCAGCHKPLDVGKTLMRGLVQTFGWGKPRLCEYTGQLFCASCHTNETSVLPARVLHHWDFSLYPVSQLAKAYLESIYDQPMLCVSAVNPFLFSKVPALLHVMGIRKKIGAMLPYLRCPFRRSIQRSLGTRRYLLESNEFFALRDLVDLSKGAFAALPFMVETVSRKILEHIAQRCLVCCDVGIPCGARQACEDPSSLIFPFQELEITRCSSCDAVFHKPCFGKLAGCPCSTAEVGDKRDSIECGKHEDSNELGGFLDTSAGKPGSKSAVGFFSDLWRPRKTNPVILMGSFPSTAL
ncbi:uncharacterized protein LOC131243720 isoform X2 [Magnolia sinica]|uniref:uncharacterized protein LOC131243720 isoform X2 n=1 Tax=Magnolia sinica TaxID=86752 RepID=UPI002658E835|nr:uncharacterized protein LOC131243720 isoform X2 [Magnolia sinica]